VRAKRRVVEVLFAGSTDRWHWSEDVLPALSFCVDTLLRDGLSVAPFDQHPDGDGSLRELGLDADGWHRWVAALIEQNTVLSRSAAALTEGRQAEARALGIEAASVLLSHPGAACPGADALRVRLDEMWADHEPAADAWKRLMTMGGRTDRRRGAPADQRQRWQALRPFQDRLRTISVFLVDYPVPVVMVIPPTTCVIAPGADAATYTRQVVAAAQLLAAATPG
jgi:hypothetical protein